MRSSLLSVLGPMLLAIAAPASVLAEETTPAAEFAPETSATVDVDTASMDSGTAEPVELIEPVEPVEPVAEQLPESGSGGIGVDAIEASFDASDPGTEPPVEEAADPTPKVATTLGEIGYDEQGRRGRIHIVVPRDTLWDISDAYLGTAWVWPSIWTDNRNIANPHLIHPGDRVWITPNEMRRVSEGEAEALLAGQPAEVPAEIAIEPPTESVVEPPAAIAVEAPATRQIMTAEAAGLITMEQYESSASIVDAVTGRVMLAAPDHVYVGIGGSDVSVGDQFTIFREREKVRDPDTRKVLGYHVDILGWLQIEEVHPDSSRARIVRSNAEIERGDRLVPRQPVNFEIAIQNSPDDVDGKISFFAQKRTIMAETDFVYLNRGSLDGLEVGSPLEVYRSGHEARDSALGVNVHVPDRVVAHLLVVRAQPESAVAFVTNSEEELMLGDQFRGAAY